GGAGAVHGAQHDAAVAGAEADLRHRSAGRRAALPAPRGPQHPLPQRAVGAALAPRPIFGWRSVAEEVLDGGDDADLLDLGAALVPVADGDDALVRVADPAQARARVLGELLCRLARRRGRFRDQLRLDVVEPGVVELGLAVLLEHHPAGHQLAAVAERGQRLVHLGGAQADGVGVAEALRRAAVAVGVGPAVLQPRRRDHDLVFLEAGVEEEAADRLGVAGQVALDRGQIVAADRVRQRPDQQVGFHDALGRTLDHDVAVL